MTTALGNITPLTNDYSEIARTPLEADRCALLVVDIQEKLLPPIFQKEQLAQEFATPYPTRGHLEASDAYDYAICQGTGEYRAGDRFPAAGNAPHRQTDVLLLWQ